MSLDDWDGMEEFLIGDEPESHLHFAMAYTPEYMEQHQENIDEAEEQLVEYLLAYDEDDFDLVNPSVKYDAEGLIQ